MDAKTREAMHQLELRAGGDRGVGGYISPTSSKAILAHIATLEAREVDIDALAERLVRDGYSSMDALRRILTEALAPKPEVPVGSWWQHNDNEAVGHVTANNGTTVSLAMSATSFYHCHPSYVVQWFTRVNPPTPWEEGA